MSVLFVTATGTGVGKTFVTAALIAKLKADGRSVCALKPVASGFDRARPEESDSGILLAALEKPIDWRNVHDAAVDSRRLDDVAVDPHKLDGVADDSNGPRVAVDSIRLDEVTPWRFTAPLSPDMAAAREGRRVDFESLVSFCRRPRSADVTLIEGIGGVMVPLDERHTVLDWIAALSAPSLVVAGSYLGTLSHTLTAVGMLETRGCRVAGIVVNESAEQPVSAAETAASLRRFAASIPVAVVRRHGSPSAAASAHSRELGRLIDGFR